MTFSDMHKLPIEPSRGVYDAPRAAALAGVPESTLHYWARKGIYRPSISPDPRVRHWSWSDLLTLRVIDWLRRDKGLDEPARVSILRIRQALDELDRRGLDRSRLHEVAVVSRRGELFFEIPEKGTIRAAPGQQGAWGHVLQLVYPYQKGPDLLTPRPHLRIIPGKLHGEPHVIDTRIPSAAIYALARSGYSPAQIRVVYPEAPQDAIDEAIDLERSIDPAHASDAA
jgi:DNA-binding transcriptional MerR regulator/uncharacterized protein (DUF433 family)